MATDPEGLDVAAEALGCGVGAGSCQPLLRLGHPGGGAVDHLPVLLMPRLDLSGNAVTENQTRAAQEQHEEQNSLNGLNPTFTFRLDGSPGGAECTLPDLADEGGPLLRLLGQLGVELLDLHQSLHQHQRLCRLLQLLDVDLQGGQTRVPHFQLVPHTLTSRGGKALTFCTQLELSFV